MDGSLEYFDSVRSLGNKLDITGKLVRLYKMIKDGLQSKKWKIRRIYDRECLPDELQHLVPREEPLF